MRTTLLNENWSFTNLDPGPGYPQANVDRQPWLPATVPGHVHPDLIANGIIADPFVRMGELGCRWVDECDWSYRSRFAWTADPALPRRVLRFEGLDTVCEISLNGEPLAAHDNMFLPLEVDVSERLRAGENELRVDFRSAVRVGQERRAAYFEAEGLPARIERFDERAFVRKAGYMSGWDWGPRLVSCGIWQGVSLIEYAARIRAFTVHRENLSDGRFHVWTETDAEGHGELTLAFGEHIVRSRTDAIQELDLVIDDPKLWWPSGMGEPHLYEASARLDSGSEIRKPVGLRSIELIRERDRFGESFEFVVNGRRLWARGANWIPNDSFPSRVAEADYAAQIATCRDLGMNMLRVWGGGLYETEAFYDACDAAGILVWQDFPYACSYYPDDAPALDAARAEAEYHVRRLRDRACLALWCGNNENGTMWEGKWGGVANSPPRFYGEPIYEQVLPALLAELDPGRPYISTSPTGKPSEESGDSRPGGINCGGWGDSHYWDVWHGRGDWKYYADSDTRFSSEFGFASSCSSAQWDPVLAPSDRDPESAVVRWHDKTNKVWQTFRGYVTTHYTEPNSLEDWVYFSQLNQRDALRFGIEHYRRSEFCRGTLIWQFNDCWPVQSWAVQDYTRLLKPAGFELARLYADQLVSLVVLEDQVEVHLVNDGSAGVSGTLLLEVLSTGGEVGRRRELPVQMGVGQRGAVHSEPVGEFDPAEHLVRATVTTAGGAFGSIALLAEPKQMRLERPQIAAAVSDRIRLRVEGVAIDLVLYDPDDPANVREPEMNRPGWRALTLINKGREFVFAHPPRRLEARSLAGSQAVALRNG